MLGDLLTRVTLSPSLVNVLSRLRPSSFPSSVCTLLIPRAPRSLFLVKRHFSKGRNRREGRCKSIFLGHYLSWTVGTIRTGLTVRRTRIPRPTPVSVGTSTFGQSDGEDWGRRDRWSHYFTHGGLPSFRLWDGSGKRTGDRRSRRSAVKEGGSRRENRSEGVRPRSLLL